MHSVLVPSPRSTRFRPSPQRVSMGLDSSRAYPNSEPLMPKGRALVIVMGQLRAASMTWDNFRKNVLEECDADLAVCVPGDECFDPSNPFYRHAKYRWIIPFVYT